MRGVILAGGLGTRLYPLTHVTNKHLLPIYNKPMIFYPIATLVNAGITEVLVVTSGPHVGHFLSVLKNGKELGLEHLEYAYQEKPDGGIADALALAERFADGESIAVILGDNTTDADISWAVREFQDYNIVGLTEKEKPVYKKGARVFLQKVTDPKRFGVPQFKDSGAFDPIAPIFTTHGYCLSKIEAILEKPQDPPSDYAVTGLYFYDTTVFDKIRQIAPSQRGELEITDVNNLYIAEQKLSAYQLKGYWSDAGTFETLLQSNVYWGNKD